MLSRVAMAAGILLLFSGGGVFAQESPPEPEKGKGTPIEITSDGENFYEAGMAVATVNVVVHYGADIMYADRVSYDNKTHEAMADGNVRVYSGDRIYRGRSLKYNFETKQVTSTDFGFVNYPMVTAGQNVISPETNHYEIKDGFFTTDNREDPAYRLKASTIEIYPDDRVVLKNAVLYVGSVPVAWIPYYEQSLRTKHATYIFQLGNNGLFGAFIYNTYNWQVDPRLEVSFKLDEREKRGLAGGVDMRYKPTLEDSDGLFKAYYAHDDDYLANPSAQVRSPVYPDRYRFSLQQRAPFGNDVTTMVNMNILSDPYVTEDFFKNEFEHDRMPDNVAEATYYNQNFTISMLAREQANRFETTVEEFPGVTFENKRVKLFGSDFAYEGQSSIVNFREMFSNQNLAQNPNPPVNYGAYRWDTFHQVLYPREYFGWLSVTPRVGARLTEWSNDNQQPPSAGTDAVGRALVLAGAEASFKVSQTWLDVQNKTLAVDGLRHVAQPFIDFQYIPRPDINPTQLTGFDTRVPDVWAQPINLTSYNSIDSLDRQAVVRYGVEHKLQTKRDGLNVDLVDWSIFSDLNMDRHYNESYQQVNDRFSSIYSDMTFNPLPWLKFRSQSSINTNSQRYAMSDNGLTWQVTKFDEYTVGSRYLNNANILDNYGVPIPNSNLLYLRNFYRVNEHWQLEAMDQFEASTGRLQEQDYTVYRDLSAWQMALTYSEEEYPDRSANHSVYMSMTLKAFPEASFSLAQ
jgi:LPS-assembly protein